MIFMENEIEVEMIRTHQGKKTIFVLPEEYNHKGVRIQSISIDEKELPRTMWTHFQNVRCVNIFNQLNDKVHVIANIVNLE